VKSDLDNLAIMARMREACGVSKDSDLGKFVDETPSAVSSWKRIKSPPYAACLTIARKTGVSMEWLLLGEGKSGSTPYKRDTSMTQDEFVNKFMKALNMARDLTFIQFSGDVTEKELQRFGLYLFNETSVSKPALASRAECAAEHETGHEDEHADIGDSHKHTT